MSTLADRVNQRMAELGLRQIDLARKAKLSPPSISQWRSGHTKTISGENLHRAAAALHCNPRWLATGEGTMLPEERLDHRVSEPDPAGFASITDPLVTEAISLFRALDRRGKKEALQWLRGYSAGAKREPIHGGNSEMASSARA